MDEVDDSVYGTCQDMCPESERKMREASGRLHYLEKLPKSHDLRSGNPNGTLDEFPLTDSTVQIRLKLPVVGKSMAVKEYSRPAAGKDSLRPADLRPAPILLSTCQYLINRIVPSTALPWCKVYDFVFDRLRAVRQDMVIQRIAGKEAIEVLECIIRFHIYAGYRLCDEKADDFDSKINDTHLLECLKRLLVLYEAHGTVDISRRSEFVSYYLLANIANPEVLSHGLLMKHEICSSRVFRTSLAASLGWWNGNYIRTLRLLRSLPCLHMCAAHRHLSTIRSSAVRVMSVGFSGKGLTYPVSQLSSLLLFDDDSSAAQLCIAHGLNVHEGHVSFLKSNYGAPTATSAVSRQRCRWIDSSLDRTPINELLLTGCIDNDAQVLSTELHNSSHKVSAFDTTVLSMEKLTLKA